MKFIKGVKTSQLIIKRINICPLVCNFMLFKFDGVKMTKTPLVTICIGSKFKNQT